MYRDGASAGSVTVSPAQQLQRYRRKVVTLLQLFAHVSSTGSLCRLCFIRGARHSNSIPYWTQGHPCARYGATPERD